MDRDQMELPPMVFAEAPAVGPDSSELVCPSCRATIMTRVEHSSTSKTHITALLLLIFCFPCSCVPYCLSSCKDAHHYFPVCSAFIGSHKH
ncbi:lipopolysaccharide-induced tumor necrosis factor-alpha factor homolog [Wyeomyia smithii]|uniref:lipopolysaccharide-induced tumor necrosis factor-alpha factor homolog n=1 Tax=Wyeomyia smithii TaxID=174621 RepID=UPI0024681757|nr:lipopolysaccharide-induced tumor necrosis factor-alpha factor homolog [Wyeomyia smithii]